MKQWLKRLLETIAPGGLDLYRSLNNRRVFGWKFRSLHREVHERIYQWGEITVLHGPFRGMKYFDAVVWGPITPKWLGSYETELSEVIEEIIANDYPSIIDVGCAEGYYAVGLATRLPDARIYAFDTDLISRRQAAKLARLNGVTDRVGIHRFCQPTDIARLASERPLVICDIEGFERGLLDPVGCPSLRQLDILVEVHEGEWVPSTADLLTKRFSASHSLNEIVATDRRSWIDAVASETRLRENRDLLTEAVNEHRFNGAKWFWMKAKPVRAQSNHPKLCPLE